MVEKGDEPQRLASRSKVSAELNCAPSDTTLVTVLDHEYPTSLRDVTSRPPFLFSRGNLGHSETMPAVAIVGTRAATPEGIEVARILGRDLVTNGHRVISGLAVGIDAAGHQATLEAGGNTTAVLGAGIARVYPKAHEALARRIVESGGALVSQFWPSAEPAAINFPQRNVVTAGLSGAVIVVEAVGRSGSLDCARRALAQGATVVLMRHLVRECSLVDLLLSRGAMWAASPAEALRAVSDSAQARDSLPLQQTLEWPEDS